MHAILQREPTVKETTLGVLFLDGVFQCFTLEDAVREVLGARVETWKVPGRTAIPLGTYPLDLTYSPKFGRSLPLVVGVPGFEGIRIHPGNKAGDTDGCILLGQSRVGAFLTESAAACLAFQTRLADALQRGAACTLTLRPPLD